MTKARIIGTGSYLPQRVLSNADLEKIVETSDEWIVSRTGMKERRIAGADEFTSDMGFAAAQQALEAAKLAPEAIDMIICATVTPDYIFPGLACLLQARLKAINAAAVDIQATCTGYIYALAQAKAYIEAGMCRSVLIVAAEKLSSIVDYKDRSTCILFGDGASACVVGQGAQGLCVQDINVGADGEVADLLKVPAGGSRMPASEKSVAEGMHYIKMEGREVFKHAVRRMEASSKACLDRLGLSEEQISWLVPHQANMRIIEALAKRFNVPIERVFLTIHKYGNTSASSVGIALDELVRSGALKRGENVLLTAFGGGLTWGSAILTQEVAS